MATLPVVRGVLLCEKTIVEERTRNISLIGCFTRRLVPEFPSPPDPFVVYAVFANGRGTIPVEVKVFDLGDGELIYEYATSVTFADPMIDLRFTFRAASVIFPRSGVYEVALHSAGEPLASTVVHVALAGEQA
jgi:hypothetical protein